MNLKNKKALVFGGTSGIGLAAAIKLRDAGANVVAISRDPDKAKQIEGIKRVKCDVLDRDALSALFKDEAPYDVLVNAATGGARAMGPFLDMDLDGYRASFDKLWGYTNCVRLGTEHLAEDGNIVLVSGSPARRPRPGQIALASVGAAVEQFARTVSMEIAPRRINVVSPGIIATPMFGPESEQRDDFLKGATAKNLIDRAGTPEEVAEGIMFVVQNDFVTGTIVDVDGGILSQNAV